MVHDIYPDLLVRTGRLTDRNLLTRAWGVINRHAYERADLVMTLGSCMAQVLREKFDPARTGHGRIEVMPPWADTDVIRPIPKSENWFAKKFGQLGKLTVMYSGNMGLSHDIEMLLRAAEQLRGQTGIHFMFIGLGPKWGLVAETVEKKGLANVTLLPWQPEDVLPFSLPTADVAFISLKPELTGTMLPSKVFRSWLRGCRCSSVLVMTMELTALARQFPLGWRVPPRGQRGDLPAVAKPSRSGNSAPYRTASRSAAEEIGARTNSHRMVELLATVRGRGVVKDPRS